MFFLTEPFSLQTHPVCTRARFSRPRPLKILHFRITFRLRFRLRFRTPSWTSLLEILEPLGRSWATLGRLLGDYWATVVCPWELAGCSLAPLGPSWAPLGRSWAALGQPLGADWALLATRKGPEQRKARFWSYFVTPQSAFLAHFASQEVHLMT